MVTCCRRNVMFLYRYFLFWNVFQNLALLEVWLWITSVLASTEEGGGVGEINYIYAIPCLTGPR